jgi:hypothetical protein
MRADSMISNLKRHGDVLAGQFKRGQRGGTVEPRRGVWMPAQMPLALVGASGGPRWLCEFSARRRGPEGHGVGSAGRLTHELVTAAAQRADLGECPGAQMG